MSHKSNVLKCLFFHINNKHENNFKLKSGLDKIVNGVQVSISGMIYDIHIYIL
jgi:predicted KAP-like P-loop ATPase